MRLRLQDMRILVTAIIYADARTRSEHGEAYVMRESLREADNLILVVEENTAVDEGDPDGFQSQPGYIYPRRK